MKRFIVAAALATAFTFFPAAGYAEDSDDEAILSCGEFTNSNASWQFGDFTWVEFIVETRKSVNLCLFYSVAVDAWVVGAAGSAVSKSDLYTASVRRQVPVNDYGVWQTNGKHWRILTAFWYNNGATASFADVRPPRTPAINREEMCWNMGGTWDGYSCELANSPLIVDTRRDGYRLTGVDEGVRFDLNADGAAEQVAWTHADSDDAFLALDRNGNGRIDDGSELFGNHSPAYADQADPTAANGFEALRFGQGPSYGSSTADGLVDERDAIFHRLLLWRDVNHNGISEPEELQPLAGSGLLAIATDYKTSAKKDRHGNEFRQRAKGVWTHGEHYIYDVWLQFRE
jgi:hypothetical protein